MARLPPKFGVGTHKKNSTFSEVALRSRRAPLTGEESKCMGKCRLTQTLCASLALPDQAGKRSMLMNHQNHIYIFELFATNLSFNIPASFGGPKVQTMLSKIFPLLSGILLNGILIPTDGLKQMTALFRREYIGNRDSLAKSRSFALAKVCIMMMIIMMRLC